MRFRDSSKWVLPAWRERAAAWGEGDPVCINVCNGAHEAEARAVLDALPQQECITYYEIPTNEPWCRDHGPIFVTRDVRWSRLAPEPEGEAQSKRAIRREGAPAPLAIV